MHRQSSSPFFVCCCYCSFGFTLALSPVIYLHWFSCLSNIQIVFLLSDVDIICLFSRAHIGNNTSATMAKTCHIKYVFFFWLMRELNMCDAILLKMMHFFCSRSFLAFCPFFYLLPHFPICIIIFGRLVLDKQMLL